MGKFDQMTPDEAEAFEKEQDNSNDIYKVSARIKNQAREAANGNLTRVGDALCNLHTHVTMSYYMLAETIADPEIKKRLLELARTNESMPADLLKLLPRNRG